MREWSVIGGFLSAGSSEVVFMCGVACPCGDLTR